MPQRKRSSEQSAVLQKPYWRASDAREILDLWSRSGMPLSAFARSHGLTVNRLSNWRRRLTKAAEERVPRFHRVRVVGSSVAPGSAAQGVEILVAGGRRVAVSPGFDGDLLAEVIRVLEAMPC